MARINLGLLVLVFVVGGLAGCKPQMQADLSPDGRTVALTDDRGLVLRDVAGKQPDTLIRLDEARSPQFSPDGKWIVIEHSEFAVLVERVSGKLVKLPLISPPFAWKPDSSELVGVRDNTALVVHIPSRTVVRSYKLLEKPQFAVWLGDGRDMAFSSIHKLMSIHDGALSSRTTDRFISVLGVDRSRRKVVWAESLGQPVNPFMVNLDSVRRRTIGFPRSEFLIKESALSFKEEPTQIGKATLADSLGSKGRLSVPASISISPDGSHLAFLGIVDSSEPGLMEKYADLGGFNQDGLSAAANRRLRQMEKQMRFQTVCTTLEIGVPAKPPTKLMTRPNVSLNSASSWSEDGQTLAIVFGDEVITKKVP